jgi:hypothetical protein
VETDQMGSKTVVRQEAGTGMCVGLEDWGLESGTNVAGESGQPSGKSQRGVK